MGQSAEVCGQHAQGLVAFRGRGHSYEYLPKWHKDLSHISIFEDMHNGLIKGLFVWGSNPAVAGPNAGREGSALDKLDWMVVCDLFETETAAFWKRPGINPAGIGTEVFLLPGAAFYEKKGSLTNSGRLAQWKDQACDPPGDAGDELEILADLGEEIKRLYSGSGLEKDRPIQNLNWPYDLVIEARKGEPGGRELDALMHKAEIAVVAVDAEQVAEARRAYRRFGKGHHAAGLNFGDVFAYALARTSDEPLLFKGDDFARTDVSRVI